MRLKSYAAGPCGKMFVVENNSTTYQLSTFVSRPFITPLTGTISNSLSPLTSPTTLLSANDRPRLYAPNTDNIVMPPQDASQIYDATQVGDYIFSITKESFETVGTRLKLSPDANQDPARRNIPTWPIVHSYNDILSASAINQASPSVAHELATYYDVVDISSRTTALTARLKQKWIYENGLDSMPDSVFVEVSAGYAIAAEALKQELLFDIEKRIYDASMDYYEQPMLICSNLGAYTVNGNYMGYSQGIPANYVLQLDSGNAMLSGSVNSLVVNPIKLKNIYNNAFQTELDVDDAVLKGFRSYVGIGTMQDSIWLAYKYVRDIADGHESENPGRNYIFIERVKGLYSMTASENHKSNIYSIRIKDSGLNGDVVQTKSNYVLNVYDDVIPPVGGATLLESIDATAAKDKLKMIVEEQIKDMLMKLAPTETQLWQILWEGR